MTLNSRDFRDALGHFATGVAVISGAAHDGSAIGLTVNSFASVSLDPPLILWSLDKGSDRFRVLMDLNKFGVNILGVSDKPLSQRLSRKGEYRLEPDLLKHGNHNVPLIRTAIASLECAVESRMEGGDHVIFLGRVLGFSHSAHDKPLVYFRGNYCNLVG